MGCDIHTMIESQAPGGRWEIVEHRELFDWRSYNLFAWLADVRNDFGVTPIAPSRGLPADASTEVRARRDMWGSDAHSVSWLSPEELAGFDYEETFENRKGGTTTFREFLGPSFFEDVDELVQLSKQAPTRLVFWFDN